MGPETMKCLIPHIKILGERYTFTGEVKGGSITIWQGNYYLVITSNYSIEQCVFNEADRQAIKRKLTEWWIDHSNDIVLITRPCVLDHTRENQVTISGH
jgi:hypothetical protein